MEKSKISQSLIWAITHKNPSNIFYAIAAESQNTKSQTDRQTDRLPERQNDSMTE